MDSLLPESKRIELLEKEIKIPWITPVKNARPIALVYPNDYKIAMSSLGFLTIYKLLIDNGFNPQRFFYNLRNKANVPISIESGELLNKFDLIAFHFSFEPDYINAISMLIDANIEIDRIVRRKKHGQVLIAGGVAPTANPLPIANFFDVALIGEAEIDILSDIHYFVNGGNLLPEKGWFVSDEYFNNRGSYQVRQRIYPEWSSFDSFFPIVTSLSAFGPMNLVEITRGCPIRCKFCLTGGLYKKVRIREYVSILKSVYVHRYNTNKVGLIGAIPSLHPKINIIVGDMIYNGLSPSLSSLSVSSLNDELIELLAKGRMKTLTLGVESFDEDLQKKYGKHIEFERLIHVVGKSLKSGFKEIKIYLMLGLPEAQSDEEKMIVEKITQIKNLMKKVKPDARLKISLNPFVPKVTTEYAIEKFMGEDEYRQKISFIRSKISKLGVIFKSESHRSAHLQNLLSRGDEKVGAIVLHAAQGKNWKKLANEMFEEEESYLKNCVDKIDKTFLH